MSVCLVQHYSLRSVRLVHLEGLRSVCLVHLEGLRSVRLVHLYAPLSEPTRSFRPDNTAVNIEIFMTKLLEDPANVKLTHLTLILFQFPRIPRRWRTQL